MCWLQFRALCTWMIVNHVCQNNNGVRSNEPASLLISKVNDDYTIKGHHKNHTTIDSTHIREEKIIMNFFYISCDCLPWSLGTRIRSSDDLLIHFHFQTSWVHCFWIETSCFWF